MYWLDKKIGTGDHQYFIYSYLTYDPLVETIVIKRQVVESEECIKAIVSSVEGHFLPNLSSTRRQIINQ